MAHHQACFATLNASVRLWELFGRQEGSDNRKEGRLSDAIGTAYRDDRMTKVKCPGVKAEYVLIVESV